MRRGRGPPSACRSRSTVRCGSEAPGSDPRPGSACGNSPGRTPPRRSRVGRGAVPRSVPRPPDRSRRRRADACPRWRTHPRWTRPVRRTGALVTGSTPTQISRSTPAAFAVSTTCCRFVVEQEQVAVGVHRPGVSPWLKVLVAHERRAYKGLHIRSMRGASRETRFRQASPPSEGVVDNFGAAGSALGRPSRRPGGGTATRLWGGVPTSRPPHSTEAGTR